MVISKSDDFKDHFLVFAAITKYSDELYKDFISWNYDFIDAHEFVEWLQSNNEKIDRGDYKDVKCVANKLCEFFSKNRAGYDKFYVLLAKFISENEHYRNKLLKLLQEQDYSEDILTISKEDTKVSFGFLIKTDIYRLYKQRNGISVKDRYLLANKLSWDDANSYDSSMV